MPDRTQNTSQNKCWQSDAGLQQEHPLCLTFVVVVLSWLKKAYNNEGLPVRRTRFPKKDGPAFGFAYSFLGLSECVVATRMHIGCTWRTKFAVLHNSEVMRPHRCLY
jgi:hypothetical protein